MRFISNWTSCRSIEGIIGLVILNWHRCVVIRFSNNSCNYSFNRTSLSPIDTSRKWYLHLNNNTIKGRASTIFVSFSSSCCGGFFLGGGRLPAHTPPQPPLPLSSLSLKKSCIPNLLLFMFQRKMPALFTQNMYKKRVSKSTYSCIQTVGYTPDCWYSSLSSRIERSVM